MEKQSMTEMWPDYEGGGGAAQSYNAFRAWPVSLVIEDVKLKASD